MRYIYLLKMIQCPVCGSREVYTIVGGYIGEIYRCKKCGYSGAFVIETDEDSEDDRDPEK
jgi:transposase-like protein